MSKQQDQCRRHARRRQTTSVHTASEIFGETTWMGEPFGQFGGSSVNKLIDEIVGGMDEACRSVFRLFVLEEMNLTEIAKRLRIPRGTAASRLRRARAQLRQCLASELGADLGVESARWIDEAVPLWQMKISPLERGLLGAGAHMSTWASLRARTLGVLGLDPAARVQPGRPRQGERQAGG